MADTTAESLTRITSELKESNKAFAKATSEMANATRGLGGVGEALGKDLGLDSLVANLKQIPFAGFATALGSFGINKFKQAREDKLLAKQLGVSQTAIKIQRREAELQRAAEAQAKSLRDAAEALGLNADIIKEKSVEGMADLTGTFRNEMGQFTNNLEASQKSREQGLGFGAAASEAAQEERFAQKKQLQADLRRNELLAKILDKPTGEEEDKGFLGGILDKIKGLLPGLIGFFTGPGGLATIAAGVGATLLGPIRRIGGNVGRAIFGGRTPRFPSARGVSTAAKGIFKGALKMVPGLGLVATAAFGIFDGMSAGIEAYKETGSIGTAVKEGIAGAVSGLTFGLVSQETISDGLTSIGNFFTNGWNSFTATAGAAVEGIKNIVTPSIDTIKTKFNDGWNSFTTTAGAAVEGIKNIQLPSIDTIKTTVTDGLQSAANYASQKFEDLRTLSISENFANIKADIGTAATALATKFTEVTGIDIGETFTNLKSTVSSVASGLATKFTEVTGIDIGETFTNLKSTVSSVASGLATKFEEVTGINIGETFSGLKAKVSEVASGLNTKFAELTGIDIGETLTGLKDKVSGVASTLKTKFTEITDMSVGEIFTGLKDKVSSVASGLATKFEEVTGINIGETFTGLKTAISEKASALASKFTEITGLEIPTLEDVKTSISNIGTSISNKLGALGLPTFAEIGEKASNIAASLSSRLEGLGLPTFSEAESAMSNLATGLGSKISSMWDSVTGLFKSADEKQAEIDQRNALEEAKAAGIYTERGVRNSLIDETQLADASDAMLQAIINDNDLSRENMEKVQAELASRSEPAAPTVEASTPTQTSVEASTPTVEASTPTQTSVDRPSVSMFGKTYYSADEIDASDLKRSLKGTLKRRLEMQQQRAQVEAANPPEAAVAPMSMSAENVTRSTTQSTQAAMATVASLSVPQTSQTARLEAITPSGVNVARSDVVNIMGERINLMSQQAMENALTMSGANAGGRGGMVNVAPTTTTINNSSGQNYIPVTTGDTTTSRWNGNTF